MRRSKETYSSICLEIKNEEKSILTIDRIIFGEFIVLELMVREIRKWFRPSLLARNDQH